MGTLVVRGVADLVESPSGALWLREAEQPVFKQSARWNAASTAVQEPLDSAFCQFLARTGWVVDLDEYRAQPERYIDLVLPAWLAEERRLWLVVPLLVADELIGFVALGPARARVDLNWEVIDLLKTASRQAAGFLAQMRATEALLEARKFDAFNRMSAFVVHDLKNIVTQLSLMLKNAQRLRDNREFQEDMLATVESSLEKMRQMMLQLREGEAPPDGRSGVDLSLVSRRMESLALRQGRELEVAAREHVFARGHEQRIERVLGHVVQNALDATTCADRVWLKVEQLAGQARVEVGDTGSGMSEEYVKTRLFKPFETTKESGMGIGVYESVQYIKELGGSIDVNTEVNRGTVMTILLPLFNSHSPSDLQLASAS
jgi:putative PEP-CTERM system histidine kinase